MGSAPSTGTAGASGTTSAVASPHDEVSHNLLQHVLHSCALRFLPILGALPNSKPRAPPAPLCWRSLVPWCVADWAADLAYRVDPASELAAIHSALEECRTAASKPGLNSVFDREFIKANQQKQEQLEDRERELLAMLADPGDTNLNQAHDLPGTPLTSRFLFLRKIHCSVSRSGNGQDRRAKKADRCFSRLESLSASRSLFLAARKPFSKRIAVSRKRLSRAESAASSLVGKKQFFLPLRRRF